VYDIAAGKLLFELEGAESAHFSIVSSVAFSPNGQLIGSAGSDRILLWDVSTGKVLAELLGSNDIAFSRDGHLAATGGDVVRVWGMPPH
jgi:WD40 repeat protein